MLNRTMTFLFRLPTSKEYEEMLYVTGAQDYRCHWSSIYTLCKDESPSHPGQFIARGFTESTAVDLVPGSFSNIRLGFRPYLGITHADPFPILELGGAISFGCLSLNSLPVHIPTKPVSPSGFYMGDIPRAYDARIHLVNAQPFQSQIKWIKLEHGYIADRVLLCSVSWLDLSRQGLEKGREVSLTKPPHSL